MSEENVEIVQQVYAEWGQGNFREGTYLYDPNIVLVLRHDFLDAGVYVGGEVGGYMRDFLADWKDAVIKGEEFRSAGDTVVVAVHQLATGNNSGISIDMRFWQLWTFRGRIVIRIENIMSRSEALEAAGLSE